MMIASGGPSKIASCGQQKPPSKTILFGMSSALPCLPSTSMSAFTNLLPLHSSHRYGCNLMKKVLSYPASSFTQRRRTQSCLMNIRNGKCGLPIEHVTLCIVSSASPWLMLKYISNFTCLSYSLLIHKSFCQPYSPSQGRVSIKILQFNNISTESVTFK